MEPWLGAMAANPSGSHAPARAARQAIDEARDELGQFLGTTPGDLVFTGGGTEAANLAVLGRALAAPGAVVVSAVEHHCVLYAAQAAARLAGCEVRVVGVGADGTVDLDALAAALDRSVSVVSVQLVNNETGVVQPFAEVVGLARRRSPQAVVHTDAVQAAPWFDVAAMAAGADMVSVSAHKFGGPQGVGALAFSRPVTVAPLTFGGPQERERRAGSHNVAGIVGMAAASGACTEERQVANARVERLRDQLLAALLYEVDGAQETAPGCRKAPGHCHVAVAGVESEAVLVLLDQAGVAASAGAACASGAIAPSHVLTAMGYPPALAGGALRLTLGHTTTQDEVTWAAQAVPAAIDRLRGRARTGVG